MVSFAESVARGLDDQPRWLDCRYLYDEVGSQIYEKITEQPEYYLTRTEAGILEAQSARVRAIVGDTTVVELGSGSSTKTRHLLDAWVAEGPSRYLPVDINASVLEEACRSLAEAYDDLMVEGIAATYERGLTLVGPLAPLMLTFLGSTVGNLNEGELDDFLGMVAARLVPGDFLLLGIDLVKDAGRLEAAYNDAAGWTGRFTTNYFARMNRELGTEIPADAVEHVGLYDARKERIEIYGRFRTALTIDLPMIDRQFHIAAGEMILVEISRKFREEEVVANAARFGLLIEENFKDPEGLFALLLLRRGGS